jgi:diguanylate cyclase (GGDEF)-like protein
MAASDPHSGSDRPPSGAVDCSAPAALRERLEEEISRAERHGTQLSCLVVVIENLEEMTREHGGELRGQTLDYVAQALGRELRRFDRVGRGGQEGRDSSDHLLIILPGADGPRAEIVARRALERIGTIKVEARGTRQPLQVSVGLAAWRQDANAQSMLAWAHAALRRVDGEEHTSSPERAAAPVLDSLRQEAPGDDVQPPPAPGDTRRS